MDGQSYSLSRYRDWKVLLKYEYLSWMEVFFLVILNLMLFEFCPFMFRAGWTMLFWQWACKKHLHKAYWPLQLTFMVTYKDTITVRRNTAREGIATVKRLVIFTNWHRKQSWHLMTYKQMALIGFLKRNSFYNLWIKIH